MSKLMKGILGGVLVSTPFAGLSLLLGTWWFLVMPCMIVGFSIGVWLLCEVFD